MAKQTFLTSCPADCDTDNLLPAIPEVQDCTSYDKPYSELLALYIRPTGATNPLASWATTPTAVAGAIDNTDTTNAKCKMIYGRGQLTTTTQIEDYPGRKRKVVERGYRLEFNVDDTINHYDFLRKLQCGSTSFTFWTGDNNDKIFGSAEGVPPELVDINLDRALGRDSRWSGKIILEWTADGDMQMRTNPL